MSQSAITESRHAGPSALHQALTQYQDISLQHNDGTSNESYGSTGDSSWYTGIADPQTALEAIPEPMQSEQVPISSKKRKRANLPEGRERKRRSCRKCGVAGCSGALAVKYCTRPCRDCQQVDCRGRNTHAPDLDCQKGWGHYNPKDKRLAS